MAGESKIHTVLHSSQSVDLPSVGAETSDVTTTVTVVGAATTDAVLITSPSGLNAGLVLNGYVSAADTVVIRATNVTAGALDPGALTLLITLFK